jgi:hypothetical protein
MRGPWQTAALSHLSHSPGAKKPALDDLGHHLSDECGIDGHVDPDGTNRRL